MEPLDCNLLFRWFVGLNPDDAANGYFSVARWAAPIFSMSLSNAFAS